MKRTALMVDPETDRLLAQIAERRGIRARGPGPKTEAARVLIREEYARLFPREEAAQ